MSDASIFCPNCGAKHTGKGRFCASCGGDLEEVIMNYKSKQLPVRYQATAQSGPVHSGPVQQDSRYQRYGSDDYSDDRRHRRRDSDGIWDTIFSILFFWMCCGPRCD